MRRNARMASRPGSLFLRLAPCFLVLCVGRAEAAEPQHLSEAAFVTELASLRQQAQACAVEAKACQTGTVPERQQVDGAPGGSFQRGWEWLKAALLAAQHASSQDRVKAMQEVQTHLQALAGEASGAPETRETAELGRARGAAARALARDEFRTSTEGPSWWDRQLARVQDALLGLFTGVGRLGERAPWLAPLIEWTCFTLAAAGLLWFVRQSLQRQALRLGFSEGAQLMAHGERASADWARLAEQRAAAGDWREAVHCLYWAAIALMEGRRAWKPNATRTPREYLRLLRPGSEAAEALRRLTGEFERVWYGAAEADENQYKAALGSFQALEAARPEREAGGGPERNDLRGPQAAVGGF